ncbi:MAG: Sec-independent protein translocase protein TatC [Desulfotomaculum sp. 46_296]|nr:MAG: Sec-independent protein translocase protein TatC [Desulfotomaculum sp. 46_296]HAU30845.1 twin-arginine translocase subunit TatC [Desulfotomaculum sp.]
MAEKNGEMPVMEHLEELRRVIIVSLVATTVLAVAAYFFSDRVLAFLLDPVTKLGHRVIFTGVTEAFFVKIKVSFFAGFLAALPVILWQIWSFIMPALRKKEKFYFTLTVLISFICFLGGVVFGFFGVYRYGIMFLLRFAGPELFPMLTIDKYISFTITFLLPFGVIFEMPLITFFLAKLELISYKFLASHRRYAFLAIVVVASVITPTPDMITCLLVSGPLYLLYELSIWIVRLVERGITRRKQAEELNDLTGVQSAAS